MKEAPAGQGGSLLCSVGTGKGDRGLSFLIKLAEIAVN